MKRNLLWCVMTWVLAVSISIGQDTTPPVFTILPQNQSFSCSSPIGITALTNWYNNFGGAMATDNSGTATISATISLNTTIERFNLSSDSLCGQTKRVLVGFIATDPSGNTTGPVFATFSTFDNTPPTVTKAPPSIVAQCNSSIRDSLIGWIKAAGHVESTDDCSGPTIWHSFLSNFPPSGTHSIANGPYPTLPNAKCDVSVNITFIGRDSCGNSVATSGIFRISDTEPPQFDTLPSDITVTCAQLTPPPTVRAFDACNGEVNVSFLQSDNRSNDSTTCEYYNYQIFRRWVATDPCGNTTLHDQTVNIEDQSGPVILLTSPLEVSCTDIFANNQTELIDSLYDDCSSDIALSFTETGTIQPCAFSLLRIYTATDICGNETQEVQTILVRDDTAPALLSQAHDSIFYCNESVDFDAAFQEWLDNYGGSTSEDECSQVGIFAAVPGSYDVNNPNTLPGTPPGSFDQSQCPADLDGFVRFEEVDFLHIDLCQNVTVTSAVFGIKDTIAPTIGACPTDITVNLDNNECNFTIGEKFPSAFDDCSASGSPIIRSQIKGVTSANPGDPNTLVDTIVFNIGPFNPNIAIPTGPATITIDMRNIESDDPLEFFHIIDESGNDIGRTPNTGIQCGSAIISLSAGTLANLQDWLSDGFITVTLAPHNPGPNAIFGINDICIGDRIETIVSFPINTDNVLNATYRINGGIPTTANVLDSIDLALRAGSNNIEFKIEDCAGNEASCVQTITVVDQLPPSITCMTSIEINASQDSCNGVVVFDPFIEVSDNCFLQEIYQASQPVNQSDQWLKFEEDTLTSTYYAIDKTITFTDVAPIKYGEDAIFELEVFGNFNEIGHDIAIFGDNGLFLGRTSVNLNPDCITSVFSLDIPKGLFNNWANDGIVNFRLEMPGPGTDQIEPCGPVNANKVDEVSFVVGHLTIHDAIIDVVNGMDTLSLLPTEDSLSILLSQKSNLITYTVYDLGGNSSSCQQVVTVNDTIAPRAVCIDTSLTVNLDGESVSIDPSLIDGGSSDNCANLDLSVVFTPVTCQDVGTEVIAMLIVSDEDNNRDTCQANIFVQKATTQTTFQVGICEGDSLFLFSGLDALENRDSLTFEWAKNDSIVSTQENPIFSDANPEYNGIYTLTINGANGCSITTNLEVEVSILNRPIINISSDTVCIGDDIILSTTSFSGDVQYTWYKGIPNNGILLDETDESNLLVNVDSGNHTYYLIVNSDRCNTDASNVVTALGINRPNITPDTASTIYCEGETFRLTAISDQTNTQYLWNTPSGGTISGNPTLPITATPPASGVYMVQGQVGDCLSDRKSFAIEIQSKPPRPTIDGELVFCEGSDFQLSANNIPNVMFYLWFKNGLLQDSTTDNSLTIPDAQIDLSGDWSVAVSNGQCISSVSSPINVTVDNLINVGASNTGPACVGDSVTLRATFLPNATYIWSGPNGFAAMGQSVKAPAIAGDYKVTITTATECQNEATTEVVIVTPPQITALSTNAPACIGQDDMLTFTPTIFPLGNYTYQWSGPNGFSSTSFNPTITNLNAQDTGVYTMVAILDGCPSEPKTIRVSFNSKPSLPIISGNNNLCEGQSLALEAQSNGANNYCWVTPKGLITQASPILNIPSISIADRGLYRVFTKQDNCASDTSDIYSVMVQETPRAPVILGNTTYCNGDTIILSPDINNAASYNWVLPDNSSVTSPILTIIGATASDSGNYSLSYTLNGCTSDNSDIINVTVEPLVNAPLILTEDVSICSENNDALEICLDPSTVTQGVLYTLFTATNNNTVGTTNNDCFQLDDRTNWKEGANIWYVVGSRNGCRSDIVDSVEVVFTTPPNLEASVTTSDLVVCSADDELTLIASHDINMTEINWTSITPGLFIMPQGRSATISSFTPGVNQVLLSYSKEACANYSTDTIDIIYELPPFANDDSYTVGYNQSLTFDPLINDERGVQTIVFINDANLIGSISNVGSQYTFTPSQGYVGNQVVTYDLCLTSCPDICSTASINFDIGKNVTCELPSIITPNEDGVNDRLVIPCLNTNRANNSRLVVFNEWGDEVYSAKPYRNDWDGTYGGDPLPVGTYFVVFEPNNNEAPIRGFLIIQR